MEGMWTRFFPTTRAVRKLVADGAIGKVSMTASLGFKSEPSFNPRLFRPELAGGALFDAGIYLSPLDPNILGVPRDVSAHATMMADGVDCSRAPPSSRKTHARADAGGFTGCLSNEVVIVGRRSAIRVTRGPSRRPTRTRS